MDMRTFKQRGLYICRNQPVIECQNINSDALPDEPVDDKTLAKYIQGAVYNVVDSYNAMDRKPKYFIVNENGTPVSDEIYDNVDAVVAAIKKMV